MGVAQSRFVLADRTTDTPDNWPGTYESDISGKVQGRVWASRFANQQPSAPGMVSPTRDTPCFTVLHGDNAGESMMHLAEALVD
jgi:hypothetical protein